VNPHLSLVAVGPVDRSILETLAPDLEERVPWPVRIEATPLDPAPAWSPARGQFHSTRLLSLLDAETAPEAARVLGVGDLDLFVPVLTFVFGEARLGGRPAVLGLARLRPESYGLPADAALLRARVLREAVHEVGHTLSLLHCPDPTCVMASSVTADAVDTKSDRFCSRCALAVRTELVR